MEFGEFTALIPKGIDFRPQLQDEVRRFGAISKRARETWIGPDGFVLQQAEELCGIKGRVSNRVDHRMPSPNSGDIAGAYIAKVNAWSRKDVSKRGSMKVAQQVLYWMFRSVEEPSFFLNVARNIWPTDSETFKRLVCAKADTTHSQAYEDIVARFRAPNDEINETFYHFWYEKNFLSEQEIIERAGLTNTDTFVSEINTPNLGIFFEQGGRLVPTYAHKTQKAGIPARSDRTTVILLRPEAFSMRRKYGPASSGEKRPNNLFVSIQTHNGAADTIRRHRREFRKQGSRGIFEAVLFRHGTTLATPLHGSASIYLNDEVNSAPFTGLSLSLHTIYLAWNAIFRDRLSDNDASSYGAKFARITDRSNENYLMPGSVLYFTIVDLLGDGFRMQLDGRDVSPGNLVSASKIDHVVAIVV
ncbi:hypothetical protein [Tritonibacter mobilis]|uniref:hypothetical protein n=1 Tax=Tritonibacter mobilis TaxID=379347 RepID=UPI001C088074|nr:hypothetical protein [Tritonibacter mobilis]MBU3036471.1 hypothetical protein [Tritonibacter mobilis]WHQ84212.1 hypothetical protein OMR53_18780 [Tritonibacter mobilis]